MSFAGTAAPEPLFPATIRAKVRHQVSPGTREYLVCHLPPRFAEEWAGHRGQAKSLPIKSRRPVRSASHQRKKLNGEAGTAAIRSAKCWIGCTWLPTNT